METATFPSALIVLYTKSQAAFILSALRLFEIGHPVYFWTFTFAKVYHDWQYPPLWAKFARDIYHLYGGYICGLRVVEPHEEHGLHYHLLVNQRISIHLVRRIAKRYGIFWIHVHRKPVSIGTAYYLAKYLTKKAPKLFGPKRWGTFGGFHHCRKSDVVLSSPYTKARRKLAPSRRIPYNQELLLIRSFNSGGYAKMKRCTKLLRFGKVMSAAALSHSCAVVENKHIVRPFSPRSRLSDFILFAASRQS